MSRMFFAKSRGKQSKVTPAGRRPARPRRRLALAVEVLEDRRLLASSVVTLPGTGTVFLQGTAFVDNNNNGVFDAGDTVLANATVQLIPTNSSIPLGTATADANGSYRFNNVVAGTYNLVETPPAGFTNSAAQVVPSIITPASVVNSSTIQVTVSDALSNPADPLQTELTSYVVDPQMNAGSENVSIVFFGQPEQGGAGQFAMSLVYPTATGLPAAPYTSFCVDLNNNENFNVLYPVQPRAASTSLPANGGEIAYLYNHYNAPGGTPLAQIPNGSQSYPSGLLGALGLQVALWELEYGSNFQLTGVEGFTLDQVNNAANAFLSLGSGHSEEAFFLDSTVTVTPQGQGVLGPSGAFNFGNQGGPAKPALVTTPSPTSVALGDITPPVLTDSAKLSGGNSPAGTITFTLYDPNGHLVDTESVAVNGNGTYTTPTGYTLPTNTTVVGTYQWDATFTDTDGNNTNATDNNDPNEQVTVKAASPKIVTTPSPTSVTLGTSTVTLKDSAKLSGGYFPTGSITFTLVAPGGATVDTETVQVNGDGTYTTPTGYTLPTTGTVTGTYQWNATFTDTDGNNSNASDNNDVNEQVPVGPAKPSIVTTPGRMSMTTGGGTFATIGFWHNKNGQAEINGFDSGPSSTLLGNSLATNYKNLFGYANPYTSATLGAAPGNPPGLAGLTNAQVATVYENLWTPSGLQKNTYVQAFAVALGLYAGGGAGSFDVGNNWPAFFPSATTKPANTTLPITQILAIVSGNFSPTTGLFYGGDSTLTSDANNVLDAINMSGETPGGPTVVSSSTKLTDSAALSNGYHETGTVTFYLFAPGVTPLPDYSNNVYSDAVTVNGNGTYDTSTGTNPGGYLPIATGTYQWVAVYGGDGNNNTVTSPFGSEPEQVGTQNPAIITTTPNVIAVTLGTTPVTLKDTANLADGINPQGSITFTLVAPNGTTVDTEKVTVNGNGNYTTPTGYTLPTTGTVTGTYQWNASYSGDGQNAPDSEVGDPAERTVVSPAGPAITTNPGGTVLLGSGAKLTDSATLSNGYYETGTVTFYLLPPGSTSGTPLSSAVYTDVVTVNGNGTYTTAAGTNPGGYLPGSAGTYQWVAVYGGDGNNKSATSPFGSEPEVVQAPATISGVVYCDNNLNGVNDTGDQPESGAKVSLLDQNNNVLQTVTTGSSGSYSFGNLNPGTYTVKVTTPAPGDTAEQSHGAVTIAPSYTVTLASGGSSTGNNFAEVDYGSLGGTVFLDLNDSGNFDSGDTGISGATVKLTGTNYLGGAVSQTMTTGSGGTFSFTNLLPSNGTGYTIQVTPPSGDMNGTDTVGSLGGMTTQNSGTITNIVLDGCDNAGTGYNFGELGIFQGLTATIGFWHNQNGQGLINSFGTTSNGLTLANWLATNAPNLFGKNAPAFNVNSTIGTNLTNRSDSDVAAYFLSLFNVTGQKAYAQVLATAFAVFTTTNSLNTGATSRSLATKYGFTLSNTGAGAATYTVPQADWSAFGITSSGGATQTIAMLLLDVNKYAVKGVLNNGNTTLITETNDVFNAINNAGDIGGGMTLVTSGSDAVLGSSLGLAYAGTYLVSVDGFTGPQADGELARIQDALNDLNASLGAFGVDLVEMSPDVSATPDIQISLADTSTIGGVAQGVLGLTQFGGQITIVAGWNWYTGSDAGAIGGDQYDFQTVVTHELGHAVGLGHSDDTGSVMYPYLDVAQVRRDLTSNDLAVLDEDANGGPEPLLAMPHEKAAPAVAPVAAPVLADGIAPAAVPPAAAAAGKVPAPQGVDLGPAAAGAFGRLLQAVPVGSPRGESGPAALPTVAFRAELPVGAALPELAAVSFAGTADQAGLAARLSGATAAPDTASPAVFGDPGADSADADPAGPAAPLPGSAGPAKGVIPAAPAAGAEDGPAPTAGPSDSWLLFLPKADDGLRSDVAATGAPVASLAGAVLLAGSTLPQVILRRDERRGNDTSHRRRSGK